MKLNVFEYIDVTVLYASVCVLCVCCMCTWSPAPISSSALLICTPLAICGDCCSIATKRFKVRQSKPNNWRFFNLVTNSLDYSISIPNRVRSMCIRCTEKRMHPWFITFPSISLSTFYSLWHMVFSLYLIDDVRDCTFSSHSYNIVIEYPAIQYHTLIVSKRK